MKMSGIRRRGPLSFRVTGQFPEFSYDAKMLRGDALAATPAAACRAV